MLAKREPVAARMVPMLLAMMVVMDVQAQSASPARYPWDKRPEECFQSSGAADSRCGSDDWPTWNDTFQRVAYLYSAEQFGLLERALRELTSSRKSFLNGDSPANAAYWVFRRM